MLDEVNSRRGNRLLEALGDTEAALLHPHFQLTEMQVDETLIEPGTEVERLFFPVSGVVSVTTSGTRPVGLALVGFEGMVGAFSVILGAQQSPYRQFVQSRGQAFAISRGALEGAIERSAKLRQLLACYVHSLTIQVSGTASSNVTLDIEGRLARWIVMCQDRLGASDLELTHDHIAVMLGVQRTSVTLAVQVLEGRGAIRAGRKRLSVRDRDILLMLAGAEYGLPEAELDRCLDDSRQVTLPT